jgi:kynureninase
MVEHPTSFEGDHIGSQSCDDISNVIYLNNAGQAWLDAEVQATGRAMVSSPPFVHPSTDIPTKIRRSFSQLIHSNPEEIAIVPSTAFAITIASKNIQRMYMEQQKKGRSNDRARNKILLLQDQMCSAVYPWQDIADQSMASGNPLSLQIVPPSSGGWTQAVLSHLAKNANEILVTCLPPLHWSDGAIVDLEQIAPVCHANDILLVIDATQAVGIMPLNVRNLQPAILACSIHKWLRGPSGASLMYIDKSLHSKWEPLDQHGRSRDIKDGPNWESYSNQMTQKGYPERYILDARKFDGGGKPNPILLPMLQKSLQQIGARVNLETCQEQLRMIVEPFLTWVATNQEKFLLPMSPHVYHLIGIRPTKEWLSIDQMLEVAKKLQDDYQVFIAVRCGVFRISPYLNTTADTMERFARTFDEVVTPYWMEKQK